MNVVQEGVAFEEAGERICLQLLTRVSSLNFQTATRPLQTTIMGSFGKLGTQLCPTGGKQTESSHPTSNKWEGSRSYIRFLLKKIRLLAKAKRNTEEGSGTAATTN